MKNRWVGKGALRRAHHFNPDARLNGGRGAGRIRVRCLCPPCELASEAAGMIGAARVAQATTRALSSSKGGATRRLRITSNGGAKNDGASNGGEATCAAIPSDGDASPSDGDASPNVFDPSRGADPSLDPVPVPHLGHGRRHGHGHRRGHLSPLRD
jgi:hypothetical protein